MLFPDKMSNIGLQYVKELILPKGVFYIANLRLYTLTIVTFYRLKTFL